MIARGCTVEFTEPVAVPGLGVAPKGTRAYVFRVFGNDALVQVEEYEPLFAPISCMVLLSDSPLGRLADELCQLDPAELDAFIIERQLTTMPMADRRPEHFEAAAGELLERYSPGDAVALIHSRIEGGQV